jgi:hypothetical protein
MFLLLPANRITAHWIALKFKFCYSVAEVELIFDSSSLGSEYSKCFRFSAKVFNDVGYVNLGNYSTYTDALQNKKLKCLF